MKKVLRKVRRALTVAMGIILAVETINCSAMIAKAADAYFYLYTNGTEIPEEPKSHPDAEYMAIGVGQINDEVAEGITTSTKTWITDDELLASIIEAAPEVENEVIWYVAKKEWDGKIHVDGIEKQKIIPPAPVETETPAPVETETPAPVETETPAPVETETPAPVETETPAPVETETPAPVETETPAPTNPTPTPEQPESPVPTNPTPAPEQPVVPTTPEQPVVPTTPEQPVVPTTPEQPVVPGTPGGNQVPNVATPVVPVTPTEVVPEEPVTPEVAEVPEEETEVVELEEEQIPLADTVITDNGDSDGDALTDIEEEETPLAASNCWIHWLLLVLTAVYTVYELVRAVARNKKIKEMEAGKATVNA